MISYDICFFLFGDSTWKGYINSAAQILFFACIIYGLYVVNFEQWIIAFNISFNVVRVSGATYVEAEAIMLR